MIRWAWVTAWIVALTVGLSAQVPPSTTITANLTSATCPGTGCAVLNVTGYASVAFQLSGTWSATVAFEGSVDGSTYQALTVLPTNTAATTTTAVVNGVWSGTVAGLTRIRARVSAYTSGTATITIRAAQSGGGTGGSGSGVVTNVGLFTVQAEQAGFWDVTNITGTVSLPTGAATEAKQDTGNTSAAAINTVLGAKTDAKSTSTDTTSVSAISVLKQISASVQAPPSQAVTNAGTFLVQAAESGTWTVQPGNTANTTAWLVKHAPGTPVLANALSTTPATVVGSAGILDAYFCYNPNATVAYVQVFDISGSVTLGTSVPKWSLAIPPTSAGNLSQMALTFANAIKVAATTTATGMTAPGAALDCNFSYR